MRCSLVERGLLAGRAHAALDAVLAASGREAALHFGRYLPTASLGAFEVAETAVRADFCRSQGIDLIRRRSGGGALYLDPGQLTWTLSLPKPPSRALARLTALHCAVVITALGQLGVRATVKAPNDIEVQGRKIASLFVATGGAAVLLQGTLLLDVDTETLLKALRAPMEKLSAAGIQSARERFATLKEAAPGIGADAVQAALVAALRIIFDLEFAPAPLPAVPEAALPDPRTPPAAADYAFLKGPGGVLHAWLRLDAADRIAACRFGGTLQMQPGGLLDDLERELIGCRREDAVAFTQQRLARDSDAELLGWTPLAIVGVLGRALARSAQRAALTLDREEANSLMLHGSDDPVATLAQATVMLVPYCAKPPDCSWRHRDGCPECGKCEVGDAYRQARERGMEVVSIVRFEHLQETFERMRAQGVTAYVGMCCQSFYLKRQYAFDAAGMAGVLMDISGANCYELQQEDLAYAGKFEAQAYLNGAVVEKVMRFVPPAARADESDGSVR